MKMYMGLVAAIGASFVLEGCKNGSPKDGTDDVKKAQDDFAAGMKKIHCGDCIAGQVSKLTEVYKKNKKVDCSKTVTEHNTIFGTPFVTAAQTKRYKTEKDGTKTDTWANAKTETVEALDANYAALKALCQKEASKITTVQTIVDAVENKNAPSESELQRQAEAEKKRKAEVENKRKADIAAKITAAYHSAEGEHDAKVVKAMEAADAAGATVDDKELVKKALAAVKEAEEANKDADPKVRDAAVLQAAADACGLPVEVFKQAVDDENNRIAAINLHNADIIALAWDNAQGADNDARMNAAIKAIKDDGATQEEQDVARAALTKIFEVEDLAADNGHEQQIDAAAKVCKVTDDDLQKAVDEYKKRKIEVAAFVAVAFETAAGDNSEEKVTNTIAAAKKNKKLTTSEEALAKQSLEAAVAKRTELGAGDQHKDAVLTAAAAVCRITLDEFKAAIAEEKSEEAGKKVNRKVHKATVTFIEKIKTAHCCGCVNNELKTLFGVYEEVVIVNEHVDKQMAAAHHQVAMVELVEAVRVRKENFLKENAGVKKNRTNIEASLVRVHAAIITIVEDANMPADFSAAKILDELDHVTAGEGVAIRLAKPDPVPQPPA